MVKRYIPKQGDIVFISFHPTVGHEQSGTRPALVLSASDYNAHAGIFLVVPITSKGKRYPFEIPLQGKKVSGFILCDHIRSMDWFARKPVFVEKCDHETLQQAQNIIASLIQ